MIPTLSHLQFAVLSALMGGERCGRDIRESLKKEGATLGLAAFYQLMSRLEDGKLVVGRYETKAIEGHTVKTRWYEVTGTGQRAWEATRDFYFASTNAIAGFAH